MHYWRGLKVTNGLMTGTSVGYFSNHFSLYGWGGLSIDGSYTEVTGIAKYTNKNYSLTLVDIDNFSGLPKVDYFNYKAKETNHIVDLTAAYQFPFMSLSWSTVLYGNDRVVGTSTQRYLELGFNAALNEASIQLAIDLF
ncbi:hypothetical protein [Prolixibacter sp. SD074]|uniref:hypothetical protein n=1 Tax=Prolixibacter sp. SD074 TaxID=2652391 RepID=UPI00127D2413|nr:hypothetical protein [Prolixibacter sp. SD074]GET29947.1 hypothetical protein SD074_21490 [Prolixibacter sp. SD074]